MSPGPTQIDIYDFDRTIYRGDCSLDFFFFCLRRQPALLRYLPYQLFHAGLFYIGLEKRTKFKGRFFIFLRGIGDIDKYIEAFWAGHEHKIKGWYKNQDHSSDVIISASPEFLLAPVFKKLGARALIATRMDKKTGQIDGENCRGEEKVRRLKQTLPDVKVRRVYTDHESDSPILNLAKEKYLVRGDAVTRL